MVVLSAVDKERIGQYWVNTGSNATVASLIEADPSALPRLNALLAGESRHFPYRSSISYAGIPFDSASLFSYLV